MILVPELILVGYVLLVAAVASQLHVASCWLLALVVTS